MNVSKLKIVSWLSSVSWPGNCSESFIMRACLQRCSDGDPAGFGFTWRWFQNGPGSEALVSYLSREDLNGSVIGVGNGRRRQICKGVSPWSAQFSSVSSVAQSCLNLCDPMDCTMPGFPVHHQLPEFIQTHVHRVSDAIQPSHPQSSPSPPAFSLSQHHGLFKSVLHISEPKYWSFSFSISPSNEYSGLISFRIDWFDLLVVQGTLKSLFQHDSSKVSFFLLISLNWIHCSFPNVWN